MLLQIVSIILLVGALVVLIPYARQVFRKSDDE